MREAGGAWHVSWMPGLPADPWLAATLDGDGVEMPSATEGRTQGRGIHLFE